MEQAYDRLPEPRDDPDGKDGGSPSKGPAGPSTNAGGSGQTAIDQEEAVKVMFEKYEICCSLFHGFDRSEWTTGTPAERLGLLPAFQEHILTQDHGKDRCVQSVRELSQAFALAVPHEDAIRIRDDVVFFQTVRSGLLKRAPADAPPEEELDHAVRQIISRAVTPEGVMGIFTTAGLKKPDILILSDEFLAEMRGMKQRNLAVELLQKLLKGELAIRRKKNVVQRDLSPICPQRPSVAIRTAP